MPNVEFTVKNKSYSIACKEGEEDRIRNLADQLNSRVDAIAQSFASASDGLIMAITALMMEDEIKALKESGNVSNSNEQVSPNPADIEDQINEAVINAIEPITEYVESLANKLENG